MEDEPTWVTSEFAADDLNGKTVDFTLIDGDAVVSGVGKLSVLENPEGLLAVDIVTDAPGKDRDHRTETRYHLSQAGCALLTIHPTTDKADFSLTQTS